MYDLEGKLRRLIFIYLIPTKIYINVKYPRHDDGMVGQGS